MNYYISKDYEDGTTITFPLDGEERISTNCPDCGDEFTLAFSDFVSIMNRNNCDLYGTKVLCKQCGVKQ